MFLYVEKDTTIMEYNDLVKTALSSITFKEGVREAKVRSPQSFAFHTISVGTIAYEICRTIYEMSDTGKTTLDTLSKTYSIPWEQLCFFGGFIHDWNKLPGEDESVQNKEDRMAKKEEEARAIITRIAELTKNPNIKPDLFIRRIALTAEGPLPDTLHLPLWIAVKLGDMLMISDIRSVNDVYYFMNSPSYLQAINALKSVYGIELRTLSSSPRLFTLIASKRLVEQLKSEAVPLISYTDGLVYLSRVNSQPIFLSKVYNVMEEIMYGSGSEDNLNNVKENLNKCLQKNIDIFKELELKPEVIDDEERVKQIPNSIFPSKICKPFEDLVGLLKPESVSKLAYTSYLPLLSSLIISSRRIFPNSLSLHIFGLFSVHSTRSLILLSCLDIVETVLFNLDATSLISLIWVSSDINSIISLLSGGLGTLIISSYELSMFSVNEIVLIFLNGEIKME